MSLEVFGDEGDIDEHDCHLTENAREEGFVDGWESACERVAAMIEGSYHAEGDRPNPKALAMTIRALRDWGPKEWAAR